MSFEDEHEGLKKAKKEEKVQTLSRTMRQRLVDYGKLTIDQEVIDAFREVGLPDPDQDKKLKEDDNAERNTTRTSSHRPNSKI